MAFMRFVVQCLDPDSGRRQGVFQAAFELADAGELSDVEVQCLREADQWFHANLPRPARFARKRNVSHRHTHGLSWFKDSACDHLRRIREVVALLEIHDVHVEAISTDRPGYIVYEDDFQVVAEPFADTGA